MTHRSVVVLGAGFIGIPMATSLAALKPGGMDIDGETYRVTLVDVNPQRVEQLTRLEDPTGEVGTDRLAACVISERLDFLHVSSPEVMRRMEQCQAVIVCVGTPEDNPSGQVDSAVEMIEVALRGRMSVHDPLVIVMRSTVLPGTGDRVVKRLNEARHQGRFAYVHAPEFLTEGRAWHGLHHHARQPVVGLSPERARAIDEHFHSLGDVQWEEGGEGFRFWATVLYRLSGIPLGMLIHNVMTWTEAELVKLCSNAALALRISLANEVAAFSRRYGARGLRVLDGLKGDPRIGAAYLHPGPGFGGPCLPKDLEVVRDEALVFEAAWQANLKTQAEWTQIVYGLCVELEGGAAIMGRGFKPNTHDDRGSFAVALEEWLRANCEHTPRIYDAIESEPVLWDDERVLVIHNDEMHGDLGRLLARVGRTGPDIAIVDLRATHIGWFRKHTAPHHPRVRYYVAPGYRWSSSEE